ncbi:hypothetical protein B1750_gp307 [Noumeavirus]|uniref:Uncharacterized protein n=1 Tax=Marseillevirus sp. TaxID=2809551 RepID=A0AA96IYI4_9VIRU|nr:hypothetical protein B1750_gp307 [Noumeavirus]AQM73288.1 hypothetical protein NMV_307 [Noumeavirus]WNL50251.1 hypothetical protein MarDSR_212 [Marseillevirus sp.]
MSDIAQLLLSPKKLGDLLGTEKLWVDKSGYLHIENGMTVEICICVCSTVPSESIRLLMSSGMNFSHSCEECASSQELVISSLIKTLENISR